MSRLGISNFWLSIIIWGTEVPVPGRTEVVDLWDIPAVFISSENVPPAPFQFSSGRSLRTPAALRVEPVEIYLRRTPCTACKTLPLVATPSTDVWLNVGMTSCMISGIAGIYLFVNNLCGEFPLLVLVSLIFSFLPPLVRVSTNGSLFGSLLAAFFFE